MTNRPEIVAHRGYAKRYPENTLSALDAAMRVGAPVVELDVQMTADGIPVVLHDESLRRTASRDLDIREITWEQARVLVVNEPARFGGRFRDERLPRLADFVALLEQRPGVHAMIEIKRGSAERFGVERMTDLVMQVLAPVRDRCTLISFVERSVAHAQAAGWPSNGWCLNDMDDWHRDMATSLAPQVLLYDHKRVPASGLWQGAWDWALWEIVDADVALLWCRRGARYIETMAAGELLADPRLRSA
jgi:glycerophosphoryl diester phosphodiesterase